MRSRGESVVEVDAWPSKRNTCHSQQQPCRLMALQISFISRGPAPRTLLSNLTDAVINSSRAHVDRQVKLLTAPALRKFDVDQLARALVPLASLCNRSRACNVERVHPAEFERAVNSVVARLHALLAAADPGLHISQPSISLLATSLAKLRVHDRGILDALQARATDVVPAALVCRWAAEVDAPRPSLLDALPARLHALSAAGSDRKLQWSAHVATSCAMLCRTREELLAFRDVLNWGFQSARGPDRNEMATVARALALAEARDLLPASAPSPGPSMASPMVSQFQEQVAKELSALTVAFQPESAEGADFDVRVDGKRVALQCDGPTHYCWDGARLEGRTLLRDRLLAPHFDRVARISAPEWQNLAQRRALLQARLMGA
jgi:hypothetical protein